MHRPQLITWITHSREHTTLLGTWTTHTAENTTLLEATRLQEALHLYVQHCNRILLVQ